MKKTSLLRTTLTWAILILVIVVIASTIMVSSADTGNYEGSLFGGFSVLGVFLIVDIVFWIIVIKIIIRKSSRNKCNCFRNCRDSSEEYLPTIKNSSPP